MSLTGKRIAFRVDASVLIGSGHVMRCRFLASELVARGAQVVFICREHPGNLIPSLEAKFKVVRLPQVAFANPVYENLYAEWLAVTWETDAAETCRVLQEAGAFDLLISDHYGLNAQWEKAVSQSTPVLALDDLARDHFCRILVDQTISDDPAARYAGHIASQTKTLLGPEYALISPEIAKKAESTKRSFTSVSKIGVYFGASDLVGATLKTARALRGLPENLQAVFVGGKDPNLRRAVQAEIRGSPNLSLVSEVSDMAAFLDNQDLFIGAGGMNAWERACLGVPSLVMAVAENQLENCRVFAEKGMIRFLGYAADVTEAQIRQAVAEIRSRTEVLAKMSQAGRTRIDGRGLARVTDFIEEWLGQSA